MLQWMGGSRRKVITSRNLTQKRQKQFFEQRKRRRQSSNTLVEANNDGFACSQSQKENRSLDVLSFLHVPRDIAECSTSLLNVRHVPDVNGSTPRSSSLAKIVPSIIANKLAHESTHEARQTRCSSSQHMEDESSVNSVRSPVAISESCETLCEGVDDKLESYKIDSSNRLSVLDLIVDDETSESLEGTLGLEAHVAFSIEGLGKVCMETPVHSPKHSFRLFCGDHASAAKKWLKHSNNILRNFEMEVEFQGDHMHSYGDYLVSDTSSCGMPSSVRDCMPLNTQRSGTNPFGDCNIFDDILDKNGIFGTADPKFLDDDIFVKEYKNPWKRDRSADVEPFMEDNASNFSFSCPSLRKSYQKKAVDGFSIFGG